MQAQFRLPVGFIFGVLAIGLGGCCGHKPVPHPVNVSYGAGFEEKPSIEVHIVALNPREAAILENYSMTKYWTANDPYPRTLQKYVMRFGGNHAGPQSFSPKDSPKEWDSLWQAWKAQGATRLFVLAFLPSKEGKEEDKPGDQDRRRQSVPLDECKWDPPTRPLDFQLTPARVMCLTPEKAGK